MRAYVEVIIRVNGSQVQRMDIGDVDTLWDVADDLDEEIGQESAQPRMECAIANLNTARYQLRFFKDDDGRESLFECLLMMFLMELYGGCTIPKQSLENSEQGIT